MANANIGHVTCPASGELAVVRKDCRGKLYYYSSFGKFTPNLMQGQIWLNKQTVFWPSENQPPENITVTVLAAGMPPVITVNENAPKQEEKPKPLTDEKPKKGVNENQPQTPPKKSSLLSDFLNREI